MAVSLLQQITIHQPIVSAEPRNTQPRPSSESRGGWWQPAVCCWVVVVVISCDVRAAHVAARDTTSGCIRARGDTITPRRGRWDHSPLAGAGTLDTGAATPFTFQHCTSLLSTPLPGVRKVDTRYQRYLVNIAARCMYALCSLVANNVWLRSLEWGHLTPPHISPSPDPPLRSGQNIHILVVNKRSIYNF